MIKVIAGKYRSRNLLTPEEGTLPSKNIVREAMASCLASIMAGAKVLDIFSGSGALGIECLSRGAQSCVFIDKEHRATNVIKKNLDSLGESDNKVMEMDYLTALLLLKDERFDIVFADPPYALKDSYQQVVDTLLSNHMVNEGGIIILEYDGNCPIDYSAFKKAKEHKFGKSRFLTIRI